MNRYEFTITIGAEAHTAEEAWDEAVEGFSLDPGVAPEPSLVEENVNDD